MDEGSILWSGELDVIKSTPVLIARHPEHEGGLVLLQAASWQSLVWGRISDISFL